MEMEKKMKTKILSTVLLGISLCGCAYVGSQTSVITSVGTNGVPVITQTTKMSGYALLEANQAMAKFSNRSGPSTMGTNVYGPGTYIGNVNNTATDNGITNVINLLKAAAALSGGAM